MKKAGKPPHDGRNPSGTPFPAAGIRIRNADHRMDTAANEEITFNVHTPRLQKPYKIVENLIRHGFMKSTFIAKTPEIEFQALEFHATPARHINNPNRGEIGLPCLGTNAGKFGTFKTDFVVPSGAGIRKPFQCF